MTKTDPLDLLHVMQNVENHHSQKSLADEVGYSVGKVNYILKALLKKGFIKIDDFIKSNNKKAYKYLLTRKGISEKMSLTETYVVIKKKEYESLQKSLEEDKEKLSTMGNV